MRLIDADNLTEVLDKLVKEGENGTTEQRVCAIGAKMCIDLVNACPTINIVMPSDGGYQSLLGDKN